MNKIAELRTKAGITQKEFGKMLNVGQTTVSSWENGKSEPSFDTLQKIAEILDTSVDEILGNPAPTRYILTTDLKEESMSMLTELVAAFMEELPDYEKIRIIAMLKVMYGADSIRGPKEVDETDESNFTYMPLKEYLRLMVEENDFNIYFDNFTI